MHVFPRRLKGQVVTMVTSILFAAGTTIGWMNAKKQSSILDETMRRSAMNMTMYFADRSAHYIVLNDYAGLAEFLVRSAEGSDISGLQVCETNGFILGDVKRDTSGKPAADYHRGFLAPPSSSGGSVSVRGNSLVIWKPINVGGPLGWIRAVFDLTSIKSAQMEIWVETFLLAQFWVISSTVLLLFLLRPIVLAIGTLSDFARNLDEDKGRSVEVDAGTGEIRELAASLNDASHRLLVTENQIKEERERLKFSEGKYRNLIQKIKAAVIMYDREGHIISGNIHARRLMGVTEEEMVGKTENAFGFRFLHEDGSLLPHDRYPVSQAVSRNNFLNNRILGMQRAGEDKVTWVLASTDSMRDEKEEITEIILTLIDITERKIAEDELTVHQHRLESLVRERTSELENATKLNRQYLDIAGTILVAIGSDYRITMINKKGCSVLGGAVDDIIGKEWISFIPDRFRDDIIGCFEKIMAGDLQSVEYFENPIIQKDGSERLIAWHNALVRDDDGKITGSLSSGEDITEQRRAEEEIKKLNEDLRKRASALESANRELESFAYSVSHDLRAPLRHIDGFLGLLAGKIEKGLDEDGRRYLEMISTSAVKMGDLIDDLLSFSRMGRQTLSFEKVDLHEIVNDVIREFESYSDDRNIEWRIGDLPVITGDRSMLRVALSNLVSNAVKFTQTREKAVIGMGFMNYEGEMVIFIEDNGVGFEQEYAEKIFGVFQRMHRSDEFEGTGVGLAIAQRIILRHGGKIWAEGKMDRGAVFYFSLPDQMDTETVISRQSPQGEENPPFFIR